MSTTVDVISRVYTGNPFCRSVDFMYTRQISGGSGIYEEFDDLTSINSNEKFAIFLSTIYFDNLDPDKMRDDYPQLGNAYILDRMDDDLAAAVRSGQCKVIIDYAGEAAPLDVVILGRFHAELQKRGFSAGNFGMLTSNHAFKEQYLVWAGRAAIEPVEIFSYDHFVFHFTGTISIAQADEREKRRALLAQRDQPPSRKYVCLNNMPRVHRFYVLSWLIEHGHLEEGYTSCLHGLSPEIADSVWADVARYRDVSRPSFDNLLARVPLIADVDTSETRGNLAALVGGADIYSDSIFSIVTESEFSSGDVRRVTEKALKPLANLQPMLLLSSPGSLQILQDHGFKTFSPWIDETYDQIFDPVARMRAVMSEASRLLSMSASDLWRMHGEMQDVLLHNYDTLWRKAQGDYRTQDIHARLHAFIHG